MVDKIIIEGDTVRHVREETLSQATLASLAPHLTTRLPTTHPVLPQNPARFVYFDPEAGRGLILIERKPQQHTIAVRHRGTSYAADAARRDADGFSRFAVQLPFQYFAYTFRNQVNVPGQLINFTVDKSFLFWAREPIRAPNDVVYVAPCPNVDTSGSICWGGTISDSSSLSARLDDLVNNFFTTTFNEDLGHRTPFGNSLLDWETNSTEPLAYRSWPFWDSATAIPVSGIATHIGEAPPTNIAELNPSHIDLPTLPANFTVARAREWLDGLSDGARRRILMAAGLLPPVDEEIPA
jgi:hypothetical protein